MATLTGRRWHPPLTWTVCKSPYAGTPTGYRKHMEARKRKDKAGRRIGNMHKICDACRYAIRQHHEGYKKRRILNGAKSVTAQGYKLKGGEIFVDSTGTRRRLQGLAVMGWGWAELGRRLGQNGTNVGRTGTTARLIYPETVDKMRAIYNELHMIRPEETREVKVVLTRAKAKGWLPPFAWDEETMDDPYALPAEGLTNKQYYAWFWNTATMTERIEYVLERGYPREK